MIVALAITYAAGALVTWAALLRIEPLPVTRTDYAMTAVAAAIWLLVVILAVLIAIGRACWRVSAAAWRSL